MEESGVYSELRFITCGHEFSLLKFLWEFFVVCCASGSTIPILPVFAICFESADEKLEGSRKCFFEF